ncbi:NUDIX hydrolase [Pedomonas mirosovicensis]|uniref:NUDIX hydrolase n=1 Tax=Pedomonas mirosovicensis TaxID=2908641 RepID=UPI0021681405|nr:NUDIX hydrolase [Pedomonas mirosovicensis]MCH8686120.1 NUDIX hydrolase [Pedomonas mirosovicensis]
MAGNREVLGTGNYLELVREDGWEFVERNRGSGAVGIVPVTDAGELVLVEQWRAALDGQSIELPAGLVGDEDDTDEEMLVAARRELEEETGFHAEAWTHLYDGTTSAGLTSETVHIYLATGLTRIGEGGGTSHENIIVHVVPLDGIENWLAAQRQRGAMIDIKVYGALAVARGAIKPAE